MVPALSVVVKDPMRMHIETDYWVTLGLTALFLGAGCGGRNPLDNRGATGGNSFSGSLRTGGATSNGGNRSAMGGDTITGGIGTWGLTGGGGMGGAGNALLPCGGPTGAAVQAIATGDNHTCTLMKTGGVRCWGGNANGQLGDGTALDRSIPPASDVLGGVQAIATGGNHTCALTKTGGVRCWGHNDDGQLGDGSTNDRLAPTSTDMLGGV